MKLDYVVAFVMGASLWMGGIARSADVAADTPAEAPAAPMTDAQKAALHKTIETCGTCHGVNGRSIAPTFPNLAAQTAPYIELQLHAFKDQSRADPDAQAYMWGMASQLSDATISGSCRLFRRTARALRYLRQHGAHSTGKEIVSRKACRRGRFLPVRPVTAPKAQGMATFPRLAGQHAPYLLKQLLVIQGVLRTAPVMHGVVKDLTKDQMQAVVAYLESL